jgi:ABC-2 type transport system ATP-binding protein
LSSTLALEVRNLSKFYGSSSGVSNINLTVKRATLHGFLGPNGAGKSTTMKCVMGLLRKTAGEIRIFGEGLRGDGFALKRRLGYSPELPSFPSYLTGREVLMAYGGMRGMKKSKFLEQSDSLLQTVGLKEVSEKYVGKYSKGMQTRLGLAVALLGDPDLLILDEPTAGLDPLGVTELRDLLRHMISEGKTILLSSHQLSEVQQMCDTVTILKDGSTVAEGSVQQLIREWHGGLIYEAEFSSLNSELLVSLDQMEDVKISSVNENIIRFVVLKDYDIRPILAKAAVEHGVLLLSCEKEDVSLEEFFVSLVKKESN